MTREVREYREAPATVRSRGAADLEGIDMSESTKPIPREVTRVDGCNCGGGNYHQTDCALWDLPDEQITANVAASRQRTSEYVDELNRRLHAGDPELHEVLRESERYSAARQAQTDAEARVVIGGLLTDGAYLMGKRVRLEWPEGLPNGMSADDMREIGEQMLRNVNRGE